MKYVVALFLAMFLFIEVGFADQAANCAPLLSHSKVLQAIAFTRLEGERDGSEEGNWSGVYLNLLNLVLEGLDEVDHYAFGHGDRMQVKTQLLQKLSSGPTPLNPLDELQTKFSPTLSTLADSGQFETITENLTPGAWAHIRQILTEKLAQQQIIQKEQDIARSTTQESFLDLPDLKGETRLFRLIRQERFSEARQFVENPLMTPHYVNQLNKKGLTDLDFLNDYYRWSDDDQYELYREIRALARAMLHHKARTGEQLSQLVDKVVEAAKTNNTAEIQKAYDEGLNLFIEDHGVDTPLHWAIRSGHVEATELLIKLGSNIQAPGERNSPLFVAILDKAPIEVIKVLLAARPNLDERLGNNAPALFWALSVGRIDVVKLLLEHGAKADARDNSGNIVLHWINDFNAEIVPLFLGLGLDINQKNNEGKTVLHLRCKDYRLEPEVHAKIVRDLLAHGADPTLKDNKGHTPYYLTRNIVQYEARKGVRAELRKYLPSRPKQLLLDLKDAWDKMRSSSRGKP